MNTRYLLQLFGEPSVLQQTRCTPLPPPPRVTDVQLTAAAESSPVGRYYGKQYRRLNLNVPNDENDDSAKADKQFLVRYISNKSSQEWAADQYQCAKLVQRRDEDTYAPFDLVPMEVLNEIALRVVNFVAFRDVCRTWRQVMLQCMVWQGETDGTEGWYPRAELMLFRLVDERLGRITLLQNVTNADRIRRQPWFAVYNRFSTLEYHTLAADQHKLLNIFAAVNMRCLAVKAPVTEKKQRLPIPPLDAQRVNLGRTIEQFYAARDIAQPLLDFTPK